MFEKRYGATSLSERYKDNLLTDDFINAMLEDTAAARDFLEDEGYTVIGEGGFSVVIAHPEDGTKVVRISCGNDGWVQYIHDCDPSSPFAPQVFGLEVANTWNPGDQIFIAEVERLKPGVKSIHFDIKKLRETNHKLDAYLNALSRVDDARPCNFLMRGEQIVVNDPITYADDDFIAALIEDADTAPSNKGSFEP